MSDYVGVEMSYKPKASGRTIQSLLDKMLYYNDEVCYQRDPCWPSPMQKHLIRSIFNGLPIGSIHVVLSELDVYLNLLDGK